MHKLNRKIDHKKADFNNLIIRQKVDKNGTIDYQKFWKLKNHFHLKTLKLLIHCKLVMGMIWSDKHKA